MSETLKPCPFCRDAMRIILSGRVRHSVEEESKYESRCPIAGVAYELDAWNTRADAQATAGADILKERDDYKALSEKYHGYWTKDTAALQERLRAVEAERDALKHIIECADRNEKP